MDESKAFLLYWQLGISVATLALTPIFSGLVVSYQLSKNQSYWQEQQQYLKSSETFKIKADLFQRAVGTANRLYDKLVNHQIYASSRDLAFGLAQELAMSNPSASHRYQNEYEQYRKIAAQSYLDFRELSIQARQEAASLKIFFTDEVSQAFTQIAVTANAELNTGLSVSGIRGRLRQHLKEGRAIEAAQIAIQEEIDKRQELGQLKTELLVFLDKISQALLGAKPA